MSYYDILMNEILKITNPLHLYKFNLQSGTTVRDFSGRGNNGTLLTTYTRNNTLFPTGDKVASYNSGAVNFHSADFNTNFDRNTHSIVLFTKIGAAEWIDGATRVFFRIEYDANNYCMLYKTTNNNSIAFAWYGNGSGSTCYNGLVNTTEWFIILCTCNNTTGKVRFDFYDDGTWRNQELAKPDTWQAGALDSTKCVYGGFSTGSRNFIGSLAYGFVTNSVITLAQLQHLQRIINR